MIMKQVGSAGAAGKPLARGRKSAGKRLAIIHAAIGVINAKSYALATMTEIAASLDLRDATLYYYFESKQKLAFACHVHSLELFEQLLEQVDRMETSGLGKLAGFVRGMLEDADHNGPQLYFGDYSYLSAPQRHRVTEWVGQLTGVLERFLEEGIRDGSVVPCEHEVVVQLFLGMLIWLAKWVPGIENMTVDRLMSAIGIVAVEGLKPRS